ncbi:MAG: hypothetical protein NUW12_04690 [Firmicutes bacterium]|jgi:copper chaperone CopZ|nr:hypothetical protein [Bacillota bacterium]MDH7495246.1 hypothetical protein [Bacillota bacterium]
MAPQRGTRHERGAEGVPEQAAALKAAISQISGVASVSVSSDPEGRVSAIDVLVEKGVQSRRIVRDVESACAAHLGRRLPSEAITITRERAGAMYGRRAGLRPGPAVGLALGGAETGVCSAPAGHGDGVRDDRVPGADGAAYAVVGGELPTSPGTEVSAVKKYRVVSRSSTAAGRAERPPRGGGEREGGEDDVRPDPRIGVKRLGVNVYPDRIHAMVELSCGSKTFVGEEDDLPNEQNRFRVPAAAALKALDKAFGGLVSVSVDDIQVCRLSGRKTAVVLATIGSPWGDVPSSGASYVTRSEEEAVIRALLHAVNRCVTLTYGGEDSYEEDAG